MRNIRALKNCLLAKTLNVYLLSGNCGVNESINVDSIESWRSYADVIVKEAHHENRWCAGFRC